jgi:hypothetical protein
MKKPATSKTKIPGAGIKSRKKVSVPASKSEPVRRSPSQLKSKDKEVGDLRTKNKAAKQEISVLKKEIARIEKLADARFREQVRVGEERNRLIEENRKLCEIIKLGLNPPSTELLREKIAELKATGLRLSRENIELRQRLAGSI